MVNNSVSVDQVFASLDDNQFLSSELKQNIKELIMSMVKYFPNINLELLNHRIGTLQIKRASKLICKEPIRYQMKDNTILMNYTALNESDDGRRILIDGLLQVLTAKVEVEDDQFYLLNRGMIEMITNNILLEGSR